MIMSYIELTQEQICDVVEFELRQQMIAYFYDYDLPDMDNVRDIYSVWRMFATKREVTLLQEEFSDIWVAVNGM
jgi:hypothetical protein